MEEKNIRWTTCKSCGILKPRIPDGRFGAINPTSAKNKRWRDGEGRQWMGLTCGFCHLQITKARQAAKRNKKNDT